MNARAESAADCRHIVVRGDTLQEIADRNELDSLSIASCSGIEDINRLEVGQVVRLTPDCSAVEATSSFAASSPPIAARQSSSAVIGIFLFLLGCIVIAMVIVASLVMVIGVLARIRRSRPAVASTSGQPRLTKRSGSKAAHQAGAGPSGRSWHPPDQAVTVRGHAISGGMVYVGRRLSAVDRYGGIEPALIDPTLPVSSRDPDVPGDEMTYWPSYATIPARCRGAYLLWLETGRSDPQFGIGYVFLFFYGLERRILHDARTDARARAEVPALVAEIKRLLAIYGSSSNSFRSYAGRLLAYLGAIGGGGDSTDSESMAEPWRSRDLGAPVRIAIGQRMSRGEPLPAWLALRWIGRHPETRFKTAAERLPDLFEADFALHYQRAHPSGLIVKPPKSTITFSYRAASSGLRDHFEARTSIPDPQAKRKPPRELIKLIDAVHADLDGYSRWLGRNEHATSQLPGLARLPAPLLAALDHPELNALEAWARQSMTAPVEARTWSERWFGAPAATWRTSDATEAGELLDALRLGIEPDVRFGGRRPDQVERIVLFDTGGERCDPSSPSLRTAIVAIHLAAAVSLADGSVEPAAQQTLERQLEEALVLSPAERRRLRAHLAWVTVDHPGMRGVKKRVEALDARARASLADLLILVAAADGEVTAAEGKLLEQCFKWLGSSAAESHARVHEALARGAQRRDQAPIPVRPADPHQTFAIPSRPTERASPAPAAGPVVTTEALDPARIREIMEETRQAAAILVDIFAADDEPDDEPEDDPSDDIALPPRTPVEALSSAHRAVLEALRDHPTWSREAFEHLAQTHRVLPGAALEAINEAAFAYCDAPVIEAGEPFEVDPDVLSEMLS